MKRKRFTNTAKLLNKRIIVLYFSLILIVSLVGCSEKITKGEVVKKTFSPAHVQTQLVPLYINTGKTVTTIFVPYVYTYPDTWKITISAKGADGKIETATYRVTKEIFDTVQIGTEFIYKPENGTEEPEYYRETETQAK